MVKVFLYQWSCLASYFWLNWPLVTFDCEYVLFVSKFFWKLLEYFFKLVFSSLIKTLTPKYEVFSTLISYVALWELFSISSFPCIYSCNACHTRYQTGFLASVLKVCIFVFISMQIFKSCNTKKYINIT